MQLSLSGVVLVAFALAALMALVAGAIARSRYALPVGAAIGFLAPVRISASSASGGGFAPSKSSSLDGLDLISRALKAGHAFATGLKMVADEMPEPVGPEFRKTFDEQELVSRSRMRSTT